MLLHETTYSGSDIHKRKHIPPPHPPIIYRESRINRVKVVLIVGRRQVASTTSSSKATNAILLFFRVFLMRTARLRRVLVANRA
mmetsp:Transcript_688/g.1593  ORF Transcript_688/g.1593 Transcript_688/m.1593 type:complete len:84 (-) Transcript_688:782-1033(-)